MFADVTLLPAFLALYGLKKILFSDDFKPSPNLDNLPEGAAPPLADLSISDVNRKLYM